MGVVKDERKQVCVCMWVEENERNGDMEEGASQMREEKEESEILKREGRRGVFAWVE